MKKRILALALAGTTAFSVFGAAMSANAANWWDGDSTHVVANDDAYYKHYDPAGSMTWGVATSDAVYKDLENTFFYPGSEKDFGNTYDSDRSSYVIKNNSAYTAWWANDVFGNQYSGLEGHINDITKYDGYFANVNAFGKEIGSNAYYVNGDGEAFLVDKNGSYNTSGERAGVIAKRNGSWQFFTDAQWDTLGDDKENWDRPSAGDYFFVEKGKSGNAEDALTLDEAIDAYQRDGGEDYYFIVVNPSAADESEAANYETNMYRVDGSSTDVEILAEESSDTGSLLKEYDKLDSTDPTNFEEVMNTPVESSGVVYLYDYYENLPANVDMDDFSDAWATKSVAELMKKATGDKSGTIEPVTGYRGRGVRQDVMYEWEDFLDELGISDASNKELTLWAENLYQNYIYTYHDENVVVKVDEIRDGVWEIVVTDGKDVDLYNFRELLEDIMEYAPADESENAQTSELVYLMQQYAKYTGEGFVDVKPVETSDWGDLLVSLAQAPTEDEFRTANAYKRYTNKVEDLVEQYEEADTSYAVTLAEQNLYDFVTSYNSAYTYTEKADTDVLATAIDNTYFNYDWRGNTNGYYGGYDPDGTLEKTTKNDWVVDEYKNSWALYPAGDYSGDNGALYSGVDATAIKNVSAEYEWFYNVYALAYDVYTSNKYQSTVDLMATTLNEAVDALAPSYTARPSDVLGAEEANDKLANLVETDYTATMWGNRNKINTYINDRVLNDEIGRIATQNSETIAEKTANLLGDQMFQTVVTRSDIKSVKTAQSNAQAVLKALQDDEDNYNAAQANALEKAIDDCQYIIDIYNGDYSKSKLSQSVNNEYSAAVGDKDQILKSDCTNAVQAVEDAIKFKNIIQGWSQDKDDNWMYGTEEGYLNDGWHQVDGGKTWFYFNEDGTAKQSEWWQDPETGTSYWFNSNCGAAVGWAKIDGDWYYFKGNNAMKTGWEKVEGSWYYMNSSGKMVTGWCQINGTWYYFSKESNALGQMLANTTTPDGYKVDANGALVE